MPQPRSFADAEVELVIRDRMLGRMDVGPEAVLGALRVRFDRPDASPRPELLAKQISAAVHTVEQEQRLNRLQVLTDETETRIRSGVESVHELLRDVVSDEIIKAARASDRLRSDFDRQLRDERAARTTAIDRADQMEDDLASTRAELAAAQAAAQSSESRAVEAVNDRKAAEQALEMERIRSASYREMAELYHRSGEATDPSPQGRPTPDGGGPPE